MLRKRPCGICRRWFYPDRRVGGRQRACSGLGCQRERRARTQAAWRRRNPDYFTARRLPTSGRLRIAGFDLETEPVEAKRRLAFMPDEPRLFEYLTVADHLALSARLYQVAGAAEKTRTLLEELELSARARALPSELSRGMKQKLVIACGLLHEPQVLIFDEPLTGIDPIGIRRMKQTILARAKAGAVVIVSSHLLHLVEEICGRVLILHRGRSVLLGTLDEVRAAAGGGDVSLEDVFFRITEAAGSTPPE